MSTELWITVAMFVVQLVYGAVLTRIASMTRKLSQSEQTRKADLQRAEDQRRADVAAMKAEHAQSVQQMATENHELTTKLLDERDRRISHSLNNHAQQVTNAMTMLQEHIKQSDQRFQVMAQMTPKLEVELVKTLAEAREFVRNSAASKEDFQRFCEETKEDRKEIVDSITNLERKVVTVEDLKRVIEELKG